MSSIDPKQADRAEPHQRDAAAASAGGPGPTVASLLTHEVRRFRALLLIDLVALGMLAMALPRPTLQEPGVGPATQPTGMVLVIFIAGAALVRWAAKKGASGGVQLGFAIVVIVSTLAATIGFMMLWSLVGPMPGTSWMDSIAPRISSVGDPVGDVVAASFLALLGLNIAWTGVSELRERT